MYERFFGLVDAPFRLTPDPRYLFLSKKHADALAHLRLGLSESSGFVCITGEVGAGKTTLLRSFLANLLPEITTAYVFNPALSALELLQTINAELGIRADTDSKKALVDALNAHLLGQRMSDRRSMVIIDEAQALSVEVLEQLRLLSNLETTTEKLLRFVLVGQPQLRALLQHPELVQLNQRITLRWHLGRLRAGETAAYVRHRLAVASRGQAPRIFTRPALFLVHRGSRGVPRLVNMIAHRAMLAAFAADSRVVTAVHVWRARREIETVPLPAAPAARRAVWAAVGAAVCVGVIALGSIRLPWRGERTAASGPVAASGTPPSGPALASLTPVVSPTPPAGSAVVPTPVVPSGAEAPSPDDEAMGKGEPAGDAAAEPAAATPGPPEPPNPPADMVAAIAPPAPPARPAVLAVDEVAARVRPVDRRVSAVSALNALLAAWRAAPLGADERAVEDMPRVGQRRGLEYLPLEGNVSMLRLLDLPAVLELHFADADVRYVTLTGLGEGRAQVTLDGAPVAVDPALLERHWFGRAHLLWRDFENLGSTLKPAMTGAPIARVQQLLGRVGLYAGTTSGVYDAATLDAVTAFQRSRLLLPDGVVGPLTRIVLYAAAGGYPRPTLVEAAEGTS